MEVDDRLRRAGRAARVLPETHVVRARGRRHNGRGTVHEEVGVRVGDRERRAAVAQHDIELVGPHEGRERHRDRADLRGTEERGDEVW